MWLRNCWYVIAWGHEIPAADAPQLFTRTVLGEPVLVYRQADGGLVALKTAAPTATRRCRSAGARATVCAAATTA
jgi:phenylpropionate dioxygenase-like ring-hydroxylating dioxygenase large terminal subunit